MLTGIGLCRTFVTLVGCALAFLGGLLLAPATPVAAATQHVTNCADSGTNSLRDRIGAAGAGDTIVFDQNCTITLTSGTLTLATNNLTINATGHNVIVDGGCTLTSGVCTYGSGVAATLNALTILHGNGGITNNGGTLTVTNSTFSGNNSGNGGGIYLYTGTVTLTNTIVALNTVSGAGSCCPDLCNTFTSGGHNLIGNTSGR